jgi:hypothetical protein
MFTGTAVLALATPLTGRVVAIERITVPWGETLTTVTTTSGSPLVEPLVVLMLAVKVFGLYAA